MEMIGGCGICGSEKPRFHDPLVYCDNCNVGVHKDCYGIVKVPKAKDNWYCKKCESIEGGQPGPAPADVSCELCPNKGGAFKKTDNDLWAHLVCALFILDSKLDIKELRKMEPIITSQILAECGNKQTSCAICIKEDKNNPKASIGATIKCYEADCETYFHVTCGQASGLLSKHINGDKVNYRGYCKLHAAELTLKKGYPKKFHFMRAYKPVIDQTGLTTNTKKRAPSPDIITLGANKLSGTKTRAKYDKSRSLPVPPSPTPEFPPRSRRSVIMPSSKTGAFAVTPFGSMSSSVVNVVPLFVSGGKTGTVNGMCSGNESQDDQVPSTSKSFLRLLATPRPKKRKYRVSTVGAGTTGGINNLPQHDLQVPAPRDDDDMNLAHRKPTPSTRKRSYSAGEVAAGTTEINNFPQYDFQLPAPRHDMNVDPAFPTLAELAVLAQATASTSTVSASCATSTTFSPNYVPFMLGNSLNLASPMSQQFDFDYKAELAKFNQTIERMSMESENRSAALEAFVLREAVRPGSLASLIHLLEQLKEEQEKVERGHADLRNLRKHLTKQ